MVMVKEKNVKAVYFNNQNDMITPPEYKEMWILTMIIFKSRINSVT